MTLREAKWVLMMGALHIEDKAHLMVGKLLNNSCWTTILSQTQVVNSGLGMGKRTKIRDGRTPIPKRNWNSDSEFLKNKNDLKKIFGLVKCRAHIECHAG